MVFDDKAYSVTVCPHCGSDLTADGGVEIESYREGIGTGFVPSNLNSDGELIDALDIVADGLHSDTLCSKCGGSLCDHELI